MLGTEALSWRDMWMIFANAPTGSVLAVSVQGERALWTVSDYLLAIIADELNDANWQRGGGKGTRPDRLKRPGVKDDSHKFGADPIPVSEFNDWWDGA